MKQKIEVTLKEADEICLALGKVKLELEQAPAVLKIVEFFRTKFQDDEVPKVLDPELVKG